MAKKKRDCDLNEAGEGCPASLVTTAAERAKEALAEAKAGSPAGCRKKLAEASAALHAAEHAAGTVLERRNAYIRATFLAGQARSCAVVAAKAPKAPPKRRKKAKEET